MIRPLICSKASSLQLEASRFGLCSVAPALLTAQLKRKVVRARKCAQY